ncbi:MAG: 50S ribosomal protein L13 [Armatimonadetes bacterium]|nr:50S ribosomal protein L13 [Anaerolineae bacterium]
MKDLRDKTHVTKIGEIERQWWVVDAEGQTLGRVASRIAPILRGKHKPTYSPHLDSGDYVVVINCDKLVVTGNRLEDKIYYHYTGFHGGMKSITLRDQLDRHPDRVIQAAIVGMLPRGRLGRAMIDKLRIYVGAEHPHATQNPQPLKFLPKPGSQ